jgi:3-hydroxyisobutyrate dehydrogenase
MIAFLGTGLLGGNFVRAARRRGEEVNVWNRTAEKARALEADGAKAFAEPAQAAKGATRIHVVLSDDAAVDEVLERARPGFSADVVIVDHTTTSPTGTKARAELWARRGIAFLHAPVFMTPQNALDATGMILGSGDKARFDSLAPVLEKMTSKVIYVGPEPERAAGYKLLGNLFIMTLTAGMRDMLGLAKAVGIAPNEAADVINWFSPGGLVGARMKRILDVDYAKPSWELAMARKDARLMNEEAERGGVPLVMMSALAAELDQWILRGHAKDDWMVFTKDVAR